MNGDRLPQFGRLVAFELGYYLRRTSTWVYFLSLLALGCVAMLALAGFFSGSFSLSGTSSAVHANSPYSVLMVASILGVLALFATAAIAGHAGGRDFRTHAGPLVFSTPAPRSTMLAARFAGTLLVNLFVYSGIGVGLWLGTQFPGLEADAVGPAGAVTYLQPYVSVLVPNIAFASALFFATALRLRRPALNYVVAIGLLVVYLVAQNVLSGLETLWIGALADPFGINTIHLATRYWTTGEKNASMLWFGGFVWANRLVWLGIAGGVLVWIVRGFRPFATGEADDEADEESAPTAGRDRPGADLLDPGRAGGERVTEPNAVAQFATLTRRGVAEMINNRYFAAVVVGGIAFLVPAIFVAGEMYGTPTHPLTYQVLGVIENPYMLYFVLVIAFFAGELVWRERDVGVDQLVDSAPVSTTLVYASKLTALLVVVGLFLAVAVATGMAAQLLQGFTRLQPGLYVGTALGMLLPHLALIAVLAVFVHVAVNHKYLGHAIIAGYYLFGLVRSSLGLEHNLWYYGSDSGLVYSDLNGYDGYLAGYFSFKVFWAAVAVLLGVASRLLWVREQDESLRARWAAARRRVTRVHLLGGAAALAIAFGAGGWIYYNTNVRNEFRTAESSLERRAAYERKYRHLALKPQPDVEEVTLDVELYPEESRFVVEGSYELVNDTGQRIDELHVHFSPGVTVDDVEVVDTGGRIAVNRRFHTWTFHFAGAILPDERRRLNFELHRDEQGFQNDVDPATGGIIVDNGSMILRSNLSPSIGLRYEALIGSRSKRLDRGLEPNLVPHIDEEGAKREGFLIANSDWVDFEATVGTAADQTAFAPGKLVESWREEGRRYFRYRHEEHMLGYWGVQSGDYEVHRGEWRDIPISVHYHPAHRYNVETFLTTAKAALDSYTRRFGEYPYDAVRIVEFPRYLKLAMGLPAHIPFSEGIGFTAKVGEGDIGYPSWVTAHEVAHMWWANALIPARVRGAPVLTETLAQYSSLTVLQEQSGRDKVEDFLEHELDAYLLGRSGLSHPEPPLYRLPMTTESGYLYYNKGAIAMWRLADVVGREAIDAALRDLLDEFAHRGPPYPVTDDLLNALEAHVPERHHPLLDQLFRRVVLHDLRVQGAVGRTAGGAESKRHDLEVTFEAHKKRFDAKGREHAAEYYDAEVVNVIVYDDAGEVLVREHEPVESGTNTVRLEVERRPAEVEVGPATHFFDRNTDDNTAEVEFEE